MELYEKNILITGGTGFLGANLVHKLIQKMHIPESQIKVFYLKNTSIQAIEEFEQIQFFEGNILNKGDLKQACKEVDVIFHTVGNTSFDPRIKKMQWLVNVEGTRNLLQVMKKNENIQKLCYTSTVNSLGCPNPIGSLGTIETSNPYENEKKVHSFDSSEDALSFADAVHNERAPKKWWKKIGIGYYDSKLVAQEMVLRAVRDQGLNIVSVLPGTFFGPYDIFIGNGMYLIRIYNNAMPGVLKAGLPLAHVSDIVRGHILAMEKGKKGERYIITGRKEDNLFQKEMAHKIAEVLQQKEPQKEIKSNFKVFPPRIAKIGAFFSELYSKIFNKPCLLSRAMIKAASYPSFYSNKKAKQELGYVPQYSFEKAVEDMYEYYQKIDYFSKKTRQIDEK